MSETSVQLEKSPPSGDEDGQLGSTLQPSRSPDQPCWVRQPYWVLDAGELASRLRGITPRGDYSLQNTQNREQRDRIIAMGGRPARAVREFSPDDTYQGFFDPKRAAAFKEEEYWDKQVCLWEDFLERKAKGQAVEGEAHSPAADTYSLHVEFREYLFRTQRKWNPRWFDDNGNLKPPVEEPPGGWLGEPDHRLEEFNEDIRDLDALIEELGREKEQGVQRKQDAQIQKGAPPSPLPLAAPEENDDSPSNTPAEHDDSPSDIPAEHNDSPPDTPAEHDDSLSGIPAEPDDSPPDTSAGQGSPGVFNGAERDHDPLQSNASMKRKRSLDIVDGVAGDIDPQQGGDASPRSPKRRRTPETDVDRGNTARKALSAPTDVSNGGISSGATRELGTASGEELAEDARESQPKKVMQDRPDESRQEHAAGQRKRPRHGKNSGQRQAERKGWTGQWPHATQNLDRQGRRRRSRAKGVHSGLSLRRSARIKAQTLGRSPGQ